MTLNQAVQFARKRGLPKVYPLSGNKVQKLNQIMNFFNHRCGYLGIYPGSHSRKYHAASRNRDRVRKVLDPEIRKLIPKESL